MGSITSYDGHAQWLAVSTNEKLGIIYLFMLDFNAYFNDQ